ncbi:MAG: AraC family transcriptional regulator [Saprospiraceae bacterium]|nr:AraC family transcriptional regulator [Saprospiraceae bacterium]
MKIEQYIPLRLKGLVEKIWEQQTSETSNWKILPSGKLELIFRIGGKSKMQSAKKIDLNDNPLDQFCFLSGLHTKPLVLSIDHFHYVGIQMKPIAVKALFGIPLYEFRDHYINGNIILKTTINKIEDILNSKMSFIEKARWLESYLYARIHETADLHLAMGLCSATDKFITNQNSIHFKSIEDCLGYSRTQSFRIFNDWFGISAYSYQKLSQFVRAVHQLHQSSDSLTQTGLQSGYFDQSHFIRSFREYADMTPGEYKQRMSFLPGQFPV